MTWCVALQALTIPSLPGVQDIVVPESYPFQPVKMKFITKVYHPNVSSASGAICLDILKDAWSPILTLKSTLISLQSLLCSPEPNDPQDAEVAKHYTTNKLSFEATARLWTQNYARNPNFSGNSGKIEPSRENGNIEMFSKMGFEPQVVVSTLHGNVCLACSSSVTSTPPQEAVLKKLNYRGGNVSQEAVVEELLRRAH